MKKIFFSVLLCAGLVINAQKKTPLSTPDFWKSNPSLEQVKAEMPNGFDFTKAEGFSNPLLQAILNGGNTQVIKYLIDQYNADLSQGFFHQRTFLHLSAQKGLGEVVEYLISKGANINAPDDVGGTPVLYAANSGDPKMVEIFAKKGVNLHQTFKDQNDANMLLLAITNDKGLKMTDYLISKGLSLNSKDNQGNGAFYYAAFNANNIDNLKELVKRGVKYDDTALVAAAQGRRTTNSLEAFQYLIEDLKLNPKTTNPEGKTLLHLIALKPNQAEIIQYLLNKGVDAKKLDQQGNSVFLIASKGKDLNTLKTFLPFIKDINAKNNDGETAIINAVRNSNAEVIDFLLSKGANLNATDKKGNGVAFALVDSYHAPRRGETKDEFTPKLQLLTQKGIDFTKPFQDESTIYHIAATKNEFDLFKKLEGIKANINAKNKDGLTALHKAALVAKDDKILKYLLSLGADKSIKTDFEETVYDLAKENEILKKKNINIDFLK